MELGAEDNDGLSQQACSDVVRHGALGHVPPWSLRMHANFADLTPDGVHFWMTLSPRTSEPVCRCPPGAILWRCHCKLVLHSLRNSQPVQVIVHQPRQTTLTFPGPSDQTCCSILNALQLVGDLLCRGRQNRVTVVDARCDKWVD